MTMKRQTVIKSAKEWFSKVPMRKQMRFEEDCLWYELYSGWKLPSEVRQFILNHYGVKVTNQCANELQQHYRRM